jgi:RNA polymerase sigma-70 factor, ECF subfamily
MAQTDSADKLKMNTRPSMECPSLECEVQSEPHTDFMDLFVAEQAMVYAFVRSVVPNLSDAEEVFQQVAMTLWRKRDSFDPTLGSFRAWAVGIARNHIRNFDRRKYREYRLRVFAPDVMDRIAESWQQYGDNWGDRETALKHCIGKLAPVDRRRLEDFYAGDNPAAEMAKSEGLSLRTFYRKIQKLRECLLNCISRTLDGEGESHGRS